MGISSFDKAIQELSDLNGKVDTIKEEINRKLEKKMDKAQSLEDVKEIVKIVKELEYEDSLEVCWEGIDLSVFNDGDLHGILELIHKDNIDFFPIDEIEFDETQNFQNEIRK